MRKRSNKLWKRRLINNLLDSPKAGENAGQQVHAQAKQSALRLLSQREYSAKELTSRLTVKFDADLVESVLQELTSLGLQCDERYARMLIRSRIARGQGPLRIEQEMKSKGLASVLINRVVQEVEVDWFELARGTRERRFGHNPPMDMKLKSKQYRFLQYRGFSAEQIQYAMNPEK